jgi:large subunit ribosomal protein LP0
MPKPTTKAEKKTAFLERLDQYIDNYSKILIIHADNVTSLQMAQVRRDLRGKAAMLMGKNTMIRRQLKLAKERVPGISTVVPKVQGNIGFIFTNGELSTITEIIEGNKKQAAAKMGAISPCNVTVPKGTTGMEPTQTAFFQVLNRTGYPWCVGYRAARETVPDVQYVERGVKVDSERFMVGGLHVA